MLVLPRHDDGEYCLIDASVQADVIALHACAPVSWQVGADPGPQPLRIHALQP